MLFCAVKEVIVIPEEGGLRETLNVVSGIFAAFRCCYQVPRRWPHIKIYFERAIFTCIRFIQLAPVVRRLDSAIQRIAIFSSFLKQLANLSDPKTLLFLT